MSLTDLMSSTRLTATSIPRDWFCRIFDGRYYLVDKQRKAHDLTSDEVSWIESLVTDTLDPLNILDVGCGYGRHSIEFSRRGHRVMGIDQSRELLEIARADSLAHGLSAEFIEADFSRPPDVLFDIVLLMHTTFGYFHEKSANEAVFRDLIRHVRPGGFLLIQQKRSSILPRQLTVDEEYDLQCGHLKYRRFSTYSDELDVWYGAYTYEDSHTLRKHILPYCIHLYQPNVFREWLSNTALKSNLYVNRGFPNNPAEEIYVIQRVFAKSVRTPTL